MGDGAPIEGHLYEVTDDSGFLAIVDPYAYASFVGEDWSFAQIFDHFKAQAQEKRLFIWETGREDIWRVRITFERTDVQGFREVAGPVIATGGSLLLTNYESLTMAAQFDDVVLPEPQMRYLLFDLPPGDYTLSGHPVGRSPKHYSASWVGRLHRRVEWRAARSLG